MYDSTLACEYGTKSSNIGPSDFLASGIFGMVHCCSVLPVGLHATGSPQQVRPAIFEGSGERDSAGLTGGLYKGFHFFSIQQSVLGVGILSSGFATMSQTNVFTSHTIIYMAWMSWSAYLSTLVLLRSQSSSDTIVRLLLQQLTMLALLVMLCYASIPITIWSGSADTLSKHWACPTPDHCPVLTWKTSQLVEWAREKHPGQTCPQGIMSYLLLIISYLWQATSLLPEKLQLLQKLFQMLSHKPTLLDKSSYTEEPGARGEEETKFTNQGLVRRERRHLYVLARSVRLSHVLCVPPVYIGRGSRVWNVSASLAPASQPSIMCNRRLESMGLWTGSSDGSTLIAPLRRRRIFLHERICS